MQIAALNSAEKGRAGIDQSWNIASNSSMSSLQEIACK